MKPLPGFSIPLARRPVSAFALAILSTATVLSGCLGGGDDEILSVEEAPEGPDSLRVGSSGVHEYLRLVTNYTGYGFDYDREKRDVFVTPLDETIYLERRVGSVHDDFDAFLRVRPVVEYQYTITDLKPAEGQSPIDGYRYALDVGTRKVAWVGTNHNISVQELDCWFSTPLTPCAPTYQNFTLDGKVFPRLENEATWGSLEGVVLKLGRNVTFNRTLTYGELEYTQYLNYTPMREEIIDGVRAFAVHPESTFVRVRPAPQAAPASPSESPEETSTEKPLPKPTHWEWYTADRSVPIREVRTVWFKFQGERYFTNTLTELVAYNPPTAAIPWGEDPPEAVDRMPGATFHSGDKLISEAKGGRLSYPLADAWDAVKSDLTLLNFQDYLDSHRSAWPYYASYSPDPDNRAYTWRFLVGDENSNPYFVNTRRNLAPAPLGGLVWVTQNEDDGTFNVPYRAAANVAARQFASLNSVVDVYARMRSDAPEPVLRYSFIEVPRFNYTPPPTATVYGKLVDPNEDPTNPNNLFSTRWWSKDPIAVLLTDGGLSSENVSFHRGYDDWPWVPLPNPGPPLMGPAAVPPAFEALATRLSPWVVPSPE